MRPLSYERYVAQHRRVSALVRAAAMEPSTELREAMLEGATVILTGQFEAFLNSLGMRLAEAVTEHWDSMLPAQRRIVSRYASREILPVLLGLSDNGWPDDQDANRVRTVVTKSHNWMEIPGDFARSGPDLKVEELYRIDAAPKAIERFLAQYWPDGPRFFTWLESRGHDRNAIWLTLTQVVNVRNDVAHGLGQVPTPTLTDVRTYLARITRIVRHSIEYCEAAHAAGSAPAVA